MGAITSLEQRSVAVEPGGEATCAVLVRNSGTVVDQFTAEVLGDPQTWTRLEPATVNLLPDEESQIVVTFRPPRSFEVPAGAVPFGIRLSSREDPAGTVVEEGTLDIGAFSDIRVEVIPRKVRGRRQSRCDVAVDNLGNHPVAVAVDAEDPERALRFRPEHTDLTLDPGTTVFVGLAMLPERRFLRGPERLYPFQVHVTGADFPPVTAEGVMAQEPLLPKWLPLALAAALAALVALIALGYRANNDIRAAKAAAEQVQEVSATASAAQARAEQAASALNLPPLPPPGPDDQNGEPPAPPTVPPTGIPSPTPPGPAPGGEPIDFRITTAANPTNDPNEFARFPDGDPLADRDGDQTLAISDVVLQNPFGDIGFLRVLRVVGEGADQQESVLLEVGLENFRDLDYHFIQPLRIRPGERIMLAVNCQNPPPSDEQGEPDICTPSGFFSGVLESPPPAPAAPTTSPESSNGSGQPDQ